MTEPEQTLKNVSSFSAAAPPIAGSPEVDVALSDRLTDILKTICETTEWEHGEAWKVTSDGKILAIHSATATHTQLSSDHTTNWEHFHACSQEFVLQAGEGLPGRVWASGQAEWIVDVSAGSESYFLRNQIAKAFGAKASLGLPVSIGQHLVILVFFMATARTEDKQLMERTQATIDRLLQSR